MLDLGACGPLKISHKCLLFGAQSGPNVSEVANLLQRRAVLGVGGGPQAARAGVTLERVFYIHIVRKTRLNLTQG